MMPPRVSVILPVYNAEPYLAEALDSILAQTFTDFELLAHDDGSTDGSLAVLQEYAAQDARLILTSEPNKGLIATLNQLIAAARGELLIRMDGDDICLPERFAKQVTFMDAHPGHVMAGSATLTMDGNGRPIAPNTAPEDHETIDQRNLRGQTAIEHPAVIMRRNAVLAVGGYGTECPHAEDIDLWLKLAETGRLANLPDVLLQYRIHDNSISALHQETQLASCRRACEAAWARRGITGTFEHTVWRMENTRASRLEYYTRYGWRAWQSGYRDTWWHYALRSVATDPLSVAAWKLLIFGAFRRPDERNAR